MTKYRDIISLSNIGFSQRSIAARCQCSRNTPAKVLSRAALAHLINSMAHSH